MTPTSDKYFPEALGFDDVMLILSEIHDQQHHATASRLEWFGKWQGILKKPAQTAALILIGSSLEAASSGVVSLEVVKQILMDTHAGLKNIPTSLRRAEEIDRQQGMRHSEVCQWLMRYLPVMIINEARW